ncbi:serine hydrolase domain-containing protein [Pseudoalteromonas sp. S16_S37]|uniref:serine hydrolase domain-containing protein n=1 Tax=Pseudoalteromonas sp. S16_S37 TaxID=2720228 RepID=UPI001680350F|nr:serine hydrolase domain-containing protein [Pseudoalteromonas sp. S16_S37]MBD1584634.1 beta-lactamase family protein [Pseudoalteromonas sp. S16_S37]
MKTIHILLVAAMILLSACGGSKNTKKQDKPAVATPSTTNISFDTNEDYQSLLDKVVKGGLTGVSVYIETPTYERFYTSGLANIENKTPLQPDHLFRIASNTKSFVATLTLMLAQEGRINLDEPIEQYLSNEISSQLPNMDTITIRHLLKHTSGLYDYLSTPEFWHKIKAEPDHDWQVTEMLSYAYGKSARFEPGKGFEYSNTNYLLLGLILDNVLGFDLAIAIRQRILEPLGLENTYYYQREEIKGTLVDGYELEDGKLKSYRHVKLGYRAADGGMVSTTKDLAKFYRAFGKTHQPFNETIKEQMLADLNILDARRQYGAGLVVFTEDSEEGNIKGKMAYFHGGYNNGYITRSYYYPKEDVSISIFYNHVFNRRDEPQKYDMVDRFRTTIRAKVLSEF